MTRLESIYAHFKQFCFNVGIEKPMAAQLWLSITDYVLKDPPIPPITKPPLSTVPNYRAPRNPEKALNTALANQASECGMQIGELRSNGEVHPVREDVRHQTDPIGENTLTARTCRGPCGKFLPIERFSKQGNSRRSICKKCDSARRVARRS